ncbi:MAG: hypothetical protein WBP72_09305 [Rhodocyclaceae bacterium]
MYLFHPSGGLGYHLRAWRHENGLWRGFRQTVAGWLADWAPPARHLVLVGPSAGYALNGAFLARFPRITAHEPDPLARWLFGRRFPGTPIAWAGALDDPAQLPQRYPDAAYLFCNLLGQTLLDGQTGWAAALAGALAERPWASYHEIVSTRRRPDRLEPIEMDRLVPLEDLLARFWHGGELEIVDHGTHGLCPDAPRRYGIWPLVAEQYHLVEWVAKP